MNIEQMLQPASNRICKFVKTTKYNISNEGIKESIESYISDCEAKDRLQQPQAEKLRAMFKDSNSPYIADIKHFYFNAAVAALGGLDFIIIGGGVLYTLGVPGTGSVTLVMAMSGSIMRGTYSACRVVKSKKRGGRVPYLTLLGIIPTLAGAVWQPIDMYLHKGNSEDERLLARFMIKYTLGRVVDGIAGLFNRHKDIDYNPKQNGE